ncbi:MAG: RNA 2',3'-cyclic phosphodiesterase [Candidatus Sulfotelmatobacter sp.]
MTNNSFWLAAFPEQKLKLAYRSLPLETVRMRLFVAVDLDEAIRARITQFLEGVRGFAPEARWVHHESLHVTLKFIGERQEEEFEKIKKMLETVKAEGFDLNFRGCGYFPNSRGARVFWIGVESDGSLESLAASVDESLARLGIPKEEHAFNAHLTLARSSAGSRAARKDKRKSTARTFQHLQEQLAVLPVPEFGTTTASEFFLYRSQLSSGGSKYAKLARFALS